VVAAGASDGVGEALVGIPPADIRRTMRVRVGGILERNGS
jgi:hypothetical protein